MSILDLEVIKKFALTCNDGYEQGGMRVTAETFPTV